MRWMHRKLWILFLFRQYEPKILLVCNVTIPSHSSWKAFWPWWYQAISACQFLLCPILCPTMSECMRWNITAAFLLLKFHSHFLLGTGRNCREASPGPTLSSSSAMPISFSFFLLENAWMSQSLWCQYMLLWINATITELQMTFYKSINTIPYHHSAWVFNLFLMKVPDESLLDTFHLWSGAYRIHSIYKKRLIHWFFQIPESPETSKHKASVLHSELWSDIC